VHVPPELDLARAIELQRLDPAVPREAGAVEQLGSPDPEPVLLVEREVAVDPRRCLVAALGARVEGHLLGVGDHRRELVEIAANELAQPQARGLGDRRRRVTRAR
jgi:hypothetical protein